MFIAAGGIKTIINFIDDDYEGCKDLIMITIDSSTAIFEKDIDFTSKLSLVMMFLKYNFLDRLILILDYLSIKKDYYTMYFQRCLNLLITFMEYGEDLVKVIISSHYIIKVLLKYLKFPQTLENENITKIMQVIEQLSIAQTRDRIDKAGLIKVFCDLYGYF